MKNFVKSSSKQLVNMLVALMGKTSIGRFAYTQIINAAMGRAQSIHHSGVELKFCVPNALNKYRADTFSTKEPETLEWIDALPKGSVVWDIGANVGLYACYAAKQRDCKVFAFEPSVFNLELLARNIFINGLTDRITIVPLPLSDTLAVSTLNMTSTEWGGALSTFGQSYGHDGNTMQKVFEFPTLGLSMVDAVERLNIPKPDYIKMDVDGIEHLILQGGASILTSVKGILIEINDKFTTQANEADGYLKQAGMLLKEKRHADYFDSDAAGSGQHTFNQIWAR